MLNFPLPDRSSYSNYPTLIVSYLHIAPCCCFPCRSRFSSRSWTAQHRNTSLSDWPKLLTLKKVLWRIPLHRKNRLPKWTFPFRAWSPFNSCLRSFPCCSFPFRNPRVFHRPIRLGTWVLWFRSGRPLLFQWDPRSSTRWGKQSKSLGERW